ncbi:DUF4351 domain-containing protein [Clostridium sp. JNZ X4-2]
MADEKVKWHPAFAAAVQLELKEYRKYLEFITEYQLTDEPLRIDVLVVKKLKEIEIDKSLGRIFKKYNILEYKSPTDYISIDDYYKIKAYAYLYKALSRETDKIGINEMTITLTSSRYPRKLIDYLKNEIKADIKKAGSGIYYIKDTDIDTQILVPKQLDDGEAGYLKLLQNQHQDRNLMKNWLTEYISNVKNPLYAVIMDVLAKVDPDEILEVYKDMGMPKISESNMEFLLDMMKKFEIDKKLKQEGKEEGREEGREEERENGRKEKAELLIEQLRKKFNGLPENYEDRIENLSNDKIKAIGVSIFDIEKIEDLERYF